MNRRQKTWAALALTPLLLVAVGATQLRPPDPTWAIRIFDFYGEFSGSNSGYSFFSPVIGSEARARFLMTDKEARVTQDTLESGLSREAALRVGNIVSLLCQRMPDADDRRATAASWAG